MLLSYAWAAMPLAARKAVERIAIEHMQNGGRLNGVLTVTHNDFAKFGIRRKSILEAITIAIALGFIIRTMRGRKSAGEDRWPSTYALTWVDLKDGTPRADTWRSITSEAEAKQRVCEALDKLRSDRRAVAARAAHTQDINSRGENAPRGIRRKASLARGENAPRENDTRSTKTKIAGGENAPGDGAKTLPGKMILTSDDKETLH